MKNNRVDHPRKSSKDLADAVCGSIFGAISHTPRDNFGEVEIHTFRDKPRRVEDLPENVINYKPKEITDEVRDYLDQFKMI
jgi:hypothetical protein